VADSRESHPLVLPGSVIDPSRLASSFEPIMLFDEFHSRMNGSKPDMP
jgi:hypothetical protein